MNARVATAVAHPNIALVKYWGKRDERLILPHQSSLSVTLAPLEIETRVEPTSSADSVEINGRLAEGNERARVIAVIDRVRQQAPGLGAVRVVSRGNFPEAAGLASSAAAFAALAVSARAAAGLPLDVAEASRLARLGSGSACRSVQGGFCRWNRGQRPDGDDSFAEQLFGPSHWPQLRFLACMVSRAEKDVKSRDGMKLTVDTSPYYRAWIDDAEAEVIRCADLLARKDLELLGALIERNAWRMHATAFAASPPLNYLLPATLAIIQACARARREGVPVWFTLDAGPNPVLMTEVASVDRVERLAREHGAADVVRCEPGGDARSSVD